jgi:prevent-host-death family protein
VSTVVNIHEAKTHLSRLIEKVERGEEVVVARAGTPVVKLVLVRRDRRPRRLGLLAGKVVIHPGFDEYDEEIAAAFEDGAPGADA